MEWLEKEKTHATGATCKHQKYKLLGGSKGMPLEKNSEIWASQSSFSSILEQKLERLNRTQTSLKINVGFFGSDFQRKVGGELPALIKKPKGNVWRSVCRICKLILELKRLRLFHKLTSVLCLLGFLLAAVFNLNMRFPEE